MPYARVCSKPVERLSSLRCKALNCYIPRAKTVVWAKCVWHQKPIKNSIAYILRVKNLDCIGLTYVCIFREMKTDVLYQTVQWPSPMKLPAASER